MLIKCNHIRMIIFSKNPLLKTNAQDLFPPTVASLAAGRRMVQRRNLLGGETRFWCLGWCQKGNCEIFHQSIFHWWSQDNPHLVGRSREQEAILLRGAHGEGGGIDPGDVQCLQSVNRCSNVILRFILIESHYSAWYAVPWSSFSLQGRSRRR